MSDTPRTDRMVASWPLESFGEMTGLARQLERENAALREQLAKRDAEIAALKGRIKQIEREHKDAMRDVAAEASRAARFPDEPYGTY